MSEMLSPIQVCIAGTGSYVPERILTNAELAILVDTSDEWIVSRTGIKDGLPWYKPRPKRPPEAMA